MHQETLGCQRAPKFEAVSQQCHRQQCHRQQWYQAGRQAGRPEWYYVGGILGRRRVLRAAQHVPAARYVPSSSKDPRPPAQGLVCERQSFGRYWCRYWDTLQCAGKTPPNHHFTRKTPILPYNQSHMIPLILHVKIRREKTLQKRVFRRKQTKNAQGKNSLQRKKGSATSLPAAKQFRYYTSSGRMPGAFGACYACINL